jgi:hypothetical protein
MAGDGLIQDGQISANAAIAEAKLLFSGSGHAHGGGADGQEITLVGDVTGDNTATVVERLQGNPVESGAPSGGDGLVWDGAKWALTAGGASTTWDAVYLADKTLDINTSTLDWVQTSTTGAGFYLHRNLATASTDEAIVLIKNLHASDEQPALSVQSAAKGAALEVISTASAFADNVALGISGRTESLTSVDGTVLGAATTSLFDVQSNATGDLVAGSRVNAYYAKIDGRAGDSASSFYAAYTAEADSAGGGSSIGFTDIASIPSFSSDFSISALYGSPVQVVLKKTGTAGAKAIEAQYENTGAGLGASGSSELIRGTITPNAGDASGAEYLGANINLSAALAAGVTGTAFKATDLYWTSAFVSESGKVTLTEISDSVTGSATDYYHVRATITSGGILPSSGVATLDAFLADVTGHASDSSSARINAYNTGDFSDAGGAAVSRGLKIGTGWDYCMWADSGTARISAGSAIARALIDLDQDDVDEPFLYYNGTQSNPAAGVAPADNITLAATNGSGAVVGPQATGGAGETGWAFWGMVKQEANSSGAGTPVDIWVPGFTVVTT